MNRYAENRPKRSAFPSLLLLILALIICICVGLFFLNRAAISKMERSIAEIDAFLQTEHTNLFENTNAYEDPPAREILETQIADVFRAPEGFLIKSYSKQWKADKLEQLYEELKKNRHGEEIETLFEIIVYPDGDETVSATHQSDLQTKTLFFNYPVLDGFSVQFTRPAGTIALYGGDTKTTIQSMAIALSHEYGHHYTFHYMFDKYDLSGSEYERIRNIPDDRLLTKVPEDNEKYLEQHQWVLCEIAADDYVALMGSPTTRYTMEFTDIRQHLAGAQRPDYDQAYMAMNAYPQENLAIPYAADVAGLAEYFYRFLNETPPSPAMEKQKMEIAIEKSSRSYDLVDGHRTFTSYELTWNTPYDQSAGVVYTLICADESGLGIPVKTVRGGQTGSALVGTAVSEYDGGITYVQDQLDEGTKTFLVTAMFPDGTIFLSEPLVHTFD